ncbi:MAG TPA: tetratricopeptide repeat protein [Myxococcaceae bacterium]
MSERNDLQRPVPTPLPATNTTQISHPSSADRLPSSPTVEVLASAVQALPSPTAEEDARNRIGVLEREAKALGNDPASALLFHEIGLLWEDPLRNPRNAAVAFQNAYRLAPRFLANIRAARRLFADVGNWQMVIQLLDAELAASEDQRQRAALLLEKAQVLEDRLSREEDAARSYGECLQLKPQDLSLLIQLEGVFAGKSDYASLVETHRLLADNLEDAALKAHYLTGAGFILEERLQKPAEAAAAFRAAFALDRKDLLLLSAMKRVAERESNTEELLQALAAEAELLGSQSAPTYLQISKVYQKLDRREDALSALLAAKRASNDPLVLAELARIYEEQGRFEDLADVLLAWVGAINDEADVVSINLRLASLYEEALKRDEDAISRYRAILSRVPGHSSALAGLGKLYFRNQNWEGLLAVYDLEIAAAEDPKQKAGKMYKAAEVMEERLERQEDAILRYNQCLQLQPGYLPAQKALTRLYERGNRFADLAAMYEQDLLQTTDKEQVVATLNKIASIYEDRLQDLDHAVETVKRVLELSPDHMPAIRNLARLYERAGRWRELIAHNEHESSLVGDTKQVLSLNHRNAEILEEHLKDRAGAIAAYERLLSLSPSYLPALKALGRLYASDGRWVELIKMYRAESEISSSTEQAASLIFKIGELYEHKVKREDEAIASYQEVLTLAPNYFPALRALARIYRGQQAWESLVEVLRAEAANRTDPNERANALFQAAAIWEDQLNRVDMSIDGYQEVLRLVPGHATAIRALERLYTTRNDVKELIAVLDREAQTASSPSAKVSAYLKLSRIYLERLNDPTRAAAACEGVLAVDAGNVIALKTLERVRASDKLRRAEVRNKLAARVHDARLRTALRLSAATDLEATGDGDLLDLLKRASAADPSDVRLGVALESALRRAGDWQGLGDLYERRLAQMTDPLEKVELALRVAEIAENRTVELEKSVKFYRLAMDLSPNLVPAIQGARRVFLRLEDLQSARQAWEAEGKASRDVRGALEAFVSAGKLCEQLKDVDGAIANYRKALERDPLDPAANRGLEELLAQRGRGEDLAQMHEKRGEAKLAQRDLPAAAAEFLSAARTWLDKADDRSKAMMALERSLAAQPTNPDALELKGRLSLEAGQYAEAAQAYASRVQQGGDARVLSAIHLKLGSLYQDQLGDPSRAAAHLQTAISGDSNSLEAIDRLATIHTQSRNWTGAADCLKRLIELEKEPAALAQHMLRLARIMDEGFADAAQASHLYRRALDLAPGDAAIIERLVILYERTGNLPELVQMLEGQANQAHATGQPQRANGLRVKVADLYARSLNNPQKAISLYRHVAEQDPQNVLAHISLADLFMRDAAAGPMAIEEHRHVLRLDPTRVDSLHALFRLWDGLRHHDKAFCAAGVLSFLRAANEMESAFYNEARNRLPAEKQDRIQQQDLDAVMHPLARTAVVEVLRAMGDQLSKLYPPNFDGLGIDRKADRLKPDHAVFRAIRTVAQVFGVEELEVYQSRRGLITLETTEPLGVCVAQDVVRRFNAREQKFIIGRAVLGLVNKTAVVGKLSVAELADVLGSSVRIHSPNFNALGRRNDELVKTLRKAYSRKALKALEGPAASLAGANRLDLEEILVGLRQSADRAGLLMCGDPAVGLGVLLREDANFSRVDSTDPVLQALRSKEDLRNLLSFALSDDYFRLRTRMGMSI